MLLSHARLPLRCLRPSLRAFWDGYSRRRGTSSRDLQATLRRAMRFAALRLVAAALEEVQACAELPSSALYVLPFSQQMMQRPRRAADLCGLGAWWPTHDRLPRAGRGCAPRRLGHIADVVRLVRHPVAAAAARRLAASPPATARRYLVDTLDDVLYRSFYTQGGPVPSQPDRGPARPDDVFVRALSEANNGSGGWERGWRVAHVDGETVHVERDGLAVRAPLADCHTADGRCAVGAAVSLRRPKELDAGAPGFYLALGDSTPALGRDKPELRVYFNVAAAGAQPLVAMSTSLLNRARIPFNLKILDDPGAFARCDAAVLYLEQRRFNDARGPLAAIAAACQPHLRTETPAFTQPITPGIAVGEHLPSLGSSFGSSRCRFVAEGIVAQPMNGASAGSPIASQPSRGASLTTASTSTPRTAPRDRRRPMRSDAFLEVAARLAHEVATTAIWCDRRCNWVAAVEGSRASGRAALATLGPDLYGGTSGVALFLAEAGVRLDDERLRATARGAIQLALDQVDRIDTPVQDGLYSGRLGVAYASVRVAALLGAADVQARAFESIDAWWRDGRRSQSSDLMSGIAGAVVGLVTVGRLQPCMVAKPCSSGTS